MEKTCGEKLEFDQFAWTKRYSVCTLVSNLAQYQEMHQSFINAGFSERDTEYIYIDNSESNGLDAFAGYNYFLNRACGEFVVLCHQDVLLDFDDRKVLEQRLAELDEIDPRWAVAGNAGSSGFGRNVIRITDPSTQNLRFGSFPSRVYSLDENFILVKNSANLAVSHDLEGFHLYGTDLCLIADILGLSCYVVDFHLRHLSAGTVDERFYRVRDALIAKYRKALRPRFIQTMIDRFYLAGSSLKVTLLNHKPILTLVKSVKRRFVKNRFFA